MSNTVTSGFIDLATFDEIEKYLYNGPTAITHFVRCVRKSTWFTQVPVPLTQNAGNPNFGGDVAFQISRAGDYLLHVWLRATLPALTIGGTSAGGRGVRWVANVGHNLIDLCYITFNDLKVQEFDSYWLDMWAAHTVSESKRNGYENMIGNVDDLTAGNRVSLPAFTVNVPLPFFFTRGSGIALPTAALPYNEMRIHVDFRNWQELVIFDNGATPGELSPAAPTLRSVQLWANYAIVSNEERVKMGKCPRDMVIEQVQRHGGRSFAPSDTNSPISYDIRFSHSIKALFWNVANITVPNSANGNQAKELSNYTTSGVSATDPSNNGLNGNDPVALSSLLYENTYRLWEMGSDYFSLVQPFYHWTAIPQDTGYHSYSYALHPESLDPTASTNFGKLTNVSLALTGSQEAVDAINNDGASFQTFIRGLNFNVVRVSGGALGLPVL